MPALLVIRLLSCGPNIIASWAVWPVGLVFDVCSGVFLFLRHPVAYSESQKIIQKKEEKKIAVKND